MSAENEPDLTCYSVLIAQHSCIALRSFAKLEHEPRSPLRLSGRARRILHEKG